MPALTGSTASCNIPTLTQHLAEQGLMAYGQTGDHNALTDRNSDRVRILRFLAQHPEGVKTSNLVHWVLKGVRSDTYYGFEDLSGDALERHDDWLDQYHHLDSGERVALDGSDDDYQFANRFLLDLEAETDLVRLEDLDDGETGGRWAFPTSDLLDLISEGIVETPRESDDLVYDREYCRKMLKATRSRLLRLSDSQKGHLANSLRRYIQRTKDYRLAFDVHLADRSGYQKRRMTKPFATRFTDEGRASKQFAMLQDSLEWGAERAETATFATLTTDPKKFDSLFDAIMAINENFHALTQWLKTDPATKADTRLEGVRQWRGPGDDVTGRPRRKLEYVKCLEFTEAGYPHLHVMFFDPPRRASDGMPWLCDKAELSHYWDKDTANRPGQGAIVDLYPLVHRDDLDELEAEFGQESGYVSWYRYGDHDHDQEWVEDHVRFHQEDGQLDFDGLEDNPQQKTAGSYLGKYVSETYARLLDQEALDDPDFSTDTSAEKSAWWKLALYWATNRRFWTPSRRIRRDIKLDADRSDVRRGVRDCVETSLLAQTEAAQMDHACYPDLDRDAAASRLHVVVRDLVAETDLEAQRADESVTTLARVEHVGTYHYADMPRPPTERVDHRALEGAIHDREEPVALASTGDRPPPVAAAWD